ncbi:nucleoside recognition domain-containing protein [Clostridium algidicarnis]|uniref:Spore maturation protein A n=2 Tax=Clostridium algidicarnis TaxID=37659 RepID=A0A2S6FYW0_9CLOT|nr:nucleoside recognition domain-containing protein [Clostridium algidicarnis]MBB6630079.1 spore maturation protein [Clostridium algidicarnis]MBB6696917.1 spore maturation protein [Clostridium algidicarnis]MBU3193266.1 spore maturation protein [Clostridium algidicarnis]MBU3196947.1 spore maturation protein [Clostridium algidicarnis]MBU3204622.1 spore maturation protein [Clostridium algidicarnis]
MINYIWFFMIVVSIILGLFFGKAEIISKAIIDSSSSTVNLTLGLLGIISLWSGIMKIAEKSGLTEKISRLLLPILKVLFKDAAKDEKALGAIVMNLSANIMGLSNAATPFGIKAMERLQELNNHGDTASNDMALFLVLNAACIQLIPTTVISLRAVEGSNNAAIIIVPVIITTSIAAMVGIICCKVLERFF